MTKPLRILQMAPIRMGGITELVLSLSENMDHSKIIFDYLTFVDTFEDARKRAEAFGGIVYRVDLQNIHNPIVRGLKKYYGIKKLVKENDFDVVHINTSTPYEVFVAIAAKAGGARHIIMHSHNTNYYPGQKLIKLSYIFKKMIPRYVTSFFACSDEAALFMFPIKIIESKEYNIIKNGVDSDQYKFNKKVREEYRKRYGFESNFVIANIGRFNVQKNHSYLIDIFKEIIQLDSSARLLLVGVGETEAKIKEKVNQYGLQEYVTFFGLSNEVKNILQMVDVVVMPSLYEGLPVVGIEAQAAGLPILMSDVVTKEMKITDGVEYVSLEESPKTWAKHILKQKGYIRRDTSDEISAAGFDIKSTAVYLETYYINMCQKENN